MSRKINLLLMGEVDSGKTSFLSLLEGKKRKESRGITQSFNFLEIPSTVIEKALSKTLNQSIEFNTDLILVDTPGHGAFVKTRDVAKQVCDLALLFVDYSKVDSIPKEFITVDIPMIVLLTKVDKIKKEMFQTEVGLATEQLWEHFPRDSVQVFPIENLTGLGVRKVLQVLNETPLKEKEPVMMSLEKKSNFFLGIDYKDGLDDSQFKLLEVLHKYGDISVKKLFRKVKFQTKLLSSTGIVCVCHHEGKADALSKELTKRGIRFKAVFNNLTKDAIEQSNLNDDIYKDLIFQYGSMKQEGYTYSSENIYTLLDMIESKIKERIDERDSLIKKIEELFSTFEVQTVIRSENPCIVWGSVKKGKFKINDMVLHESGRGKIEGIKNIEGDDLVSLEGEGSIMIKGTLFIAKRLKEHTPIKKIMDQQDKVFYKSKLSFIKRLKLEN